MVGDRLATLAVQHDVDLEMYRELHAEKNTLITKIANCPARTMQFPDPPVVVATVAPQVNQEEDDGSEEDDDEQ